MFITASALVILVSLGKSDAASLLPELSSNTSSIYKYKYKYEYKYKYFTATRLPSYNS